MSEFVNSPYELELLRAGLPLEPGRPYYPACVHRPDTHAVLTTPCDPCRGVTQPAESEQAAAGAAPPVAMLEGTFAIYQDGHGGFVLVTDTVQYGTDRRHIPAAMVKLATGGGIISRRLAGMFGGQ